MSDPLPRPPIASAPISVLLFAHALSSDTAETLRAWRQHLEALGRSYEIILIQETRFEIPANPADEPPDAAIRIFPYERTRGWGEAVNDAIRVARHPLVAFCCADKQYQPGDLDHLLKEIDKVDLVVGYRAGGQAPAWRVMLDLLFGLMSRLLLGMAPEPRVCWLGSEGWGRRWIARWIFGLRVLDPECPFRLARRAIFAHLPIQSGGPFVQIEMLAKANHVSCYLAEVPVTWTPPAEPPSEAISFGQDARLVFHAPDFHAPQNHEAQNPLIS